MEEHLWGLNLTVIGAFSVTAESCISFNYGCAVLHIFYKQCLKLERLQQHVEVNSTVVSAVKSKLSAGSRISFVRKVHIKLTSICVLLHSKQASETNCQPSTCYSKLY